MVEATTDIIRKHRIGDCLRPVEQQVVVVENALTLLCLNVAGKQRSELCEPRGAPRERRPEDIIEWHLGVHATRIDRETTPLRWKAALRLGITELVADQI